MPASTHTTDLSAIARRLFTAAPDVVVDAVVAITPGRPDEPALLLGALQVGDGTIIDALLGFEAPDEWLGVGVVAGDCTIAGDHFSAPGETSVGKCAAAESSGLFDDCGSLVVKPPTRVVYLLDRAGNDVTALGDTSEEPVVFDHRVERASGHLVDVCHRCLGLPTPAPTSSTATLIASLWLDRVADLVLGADVWPGWASLARLHPAVDPFDDVPGPERMVALAADYASHTSWARVRAMSTLGRLHLPGVNGDLASWMDAGMLSRWTERMFIDHLDLLGAMSARFGGLIEPVRFVIEGSMGSRAES